MAAASAPARSSTLDLGKVQTTWGLACQPSLEGARCHVTDYRIYLSRDGKCFTEVGSDTWPLTTSTKLAAWPAQPTRHRYYAPGGGRQVTIR